MPFLRKKNKEPKEKRNGGGRGQSAIGAAEHTAGVILGSEALKERGVQKEREAGILKQQGEALEEVERLEREALTHRERAVAQGAHPNNRRLGAGTSLSEQIA